MPRLRQQDNGCFYPPLPVGMNSGAMCDIKGNVYLWYSHGMWTTFNTVWLWNDCEARKLGHSISKVATRLGFFLKHQQEGKKWDHKQIIRRSLHHIESQFNAGAVQPINKCIVQCTLHSLELFNCWPPLTPQQWLLHFTWDREHFYWTLEDWCCCLVMFPTLSGKHICI